VMDRLNRGEDVDPATYYFRTTPYFETSSEKYSWMNRICSIATGSRKASERTLDPSSTVRFTKCLFGDDNSRRGGSLALHFRMG